MSNISRYIFVGVLLMFIASVALDFFKKPEVPTLDKKEQYTKYIIEGCMTEMEKYGTIKNGYSYCKCGAEYIVKNYTEEEMVEIAKYAGTDRLPQAMEEMVKNCAFLLGE